jgi:putative oxidoreductase
MPDPALLIPQLAPLYRELGALAEALLRVFAGLALVPHALRMAFGWFPGTGGPVSSVAEFSAALQRIGYRPGRLWAYLVLGTEFIAGPLLAVGLLTRVAAVPVVILLALSIVQHRRDGYFWNTLGIEYPIMWTLAALYFLANGGGAYSLDRLIGVAF